MLSSFYHHYHRCIYQRIILLMLGFYMSRIVYFGIMVLPIVVMSSSVLIQGASKTANIFIQDNHEPHSKTYLVAARDEKIQDCLRLGNCKD
jgi:disulfide bond formation protein DsbB